jgi:hypothetical protein
MSDFKIHVNDVPEEEENNLLVIIIDNKYKTESSFALSRTEKNAGQIRLIKSALAKVKFLNDTKSAEFKKKKEKKIIKRMRKVKGADLIIGG